MSKISFEFDVPTDKATDIVNKIALSLGYESLTGQIPTRAAFIRGCVLDFLKRHYRDGKSQFAKDLAQQTVDAEINSVIIQ